MHKLAIIIPYFKMDHLETTLRSLRDQSDQRFTLYVGNDASPDDPLPLLDRYFDRNDYHYFAYEDNLGSRNLALQWARILVNVKEAWFQILGDDDFLSPNLVEAFYKNLPCVGLDRHAMKIQSVLCDGEGRIRKQLQGRLKTGELDVVDFTIGKIGGRYSSSLSEHLFRTDIYRWIGFPKYELAWHTDDMLLLQVCDYKKCWFIAEATVFVRVYDGSISGSSGNLSGKRRASLLFFSDLSQALQKRDVSLLKQRSFLRSLKNQKSMLGMEGLEEIYRKNGLLGRIYIGLYRIKLWVKSFFPGRLIQRLQHQTEEGRVC